MLPSVKIAKLVSHQIYFSEGGQPSTEVAFGLCTQSSWVRIWQLEKLNQEEIIKCFFRELFVLTLFGVIALEKKIYYS